MEKWKIIKEDNAYYVVIDGKFIYLDNACKSTIFPHPYFTLEAAQKNLERRQKQMEAKSWQQQELPQVVDWSQPLQTDETPARKARLICDDRAGEDYNYVVLVENRIGKEVVWYCNKHGLVSQTSIRIVNVPAKTPYGREEWEKLTRVRDRAEPTKSYSIGTITHSSVAIGSMFYEMDHAATLFLTMDGKELYK